MQVKPTFIKVSVCLCAGLFAFLGYAHMSLSASNRTPLYEKIARTKKLQPPANVKIHMIEEGEIEADKVYTLEATIKAPKNFANVQWEWSAPAEVVLLDGVKGTGLQIKADEETKVTLHFRQRDTMNRRIRFVMKDASSGAILGRGMYGTTRQRAIAAENKELLERQEKYLEENSNEVFKMHEPKHFH